MVSFPELTNANIPVVRQAVAEWRGLSGQFNAISRFFEDHVVKELQRSGLQGEMADAAYALLRRIIQEFDAAALEAHQVHHAISDAWNVLEETWDHATSARDNAQAPDRPDLHIDTNTGVVTSVPVDNPWWDTFSDIVFGETAGTVDGLNSKIQEALHHSTVADEGLKAALSQDRNGAHPGFNAHHTAHKVHHALELEQNGYHYWDEPPR